MTHTFHSAIPDTATLSQLPLFFILGRPRSGTTLLASLFDAHPSVMLPFECPFIINLKGRYENRELSTAEEINEYASEVALQRGFPSWRTDPQSLAKSLNALPLPLSFPSLVKATLLNFQSFFAKEKVHLVGDKNPIYSIYPRELVRLFPTARFIYLTRDYRDHILSIRQVDFESPFVPLLAWRWRLVSKRIHRVMKSHPDQFRHIRYEDLVANPEGELTRLCEFLGIAYNPVVLNFHKMKDELLEKFPPQDVLKYHSSLLQPIDPTKVYGWKRKMSGRHVCLADFVVGRWAEMDGYQRQCRKIPWPWLPWVALCVVYGNFQVWSRQLTDHLPYPILRWVRTKGPLAAMWLYRTVAVIKGKTQSEQKNL